MAPIAACTIASSNYLALARVFAESYREHHPGAEVFVCIVDRPNPALRLADFPFVSVFAEELDIPGFTSLAFRCDVLELNTAVKPFFLRALRDRFGLERVLFFDPDVLVLDSLVSLAAELDGAELVVTPHLTAPLPDEQADIERSILAAGVYNLGFLGIRLDAETAAFLSWWGRRLQRFGVVDVARHLFVDQKWIDFAPAFLARVAVVRDPAYNVAWWNLAQRPLRRVGGGWEVFGRRLGFFHFSGFDFADATRVSRHAARLSLDADSDVAALFAAYRARVAAAGHATFSRIPYSFARFTDTEVPVTAELRRTLRRVDPDGRRWPDPFATDGADSFLAWLLEPIEVAGGVLNRAVLGLWEERAELVAAFPLVLDVHLPYYISWLAQYAHTSGGLDPMFLASIRIVAAREAGRPAVAQLDPHVAGGLDHAARIIQRIDLAHPGAMLAWLNDRLPGTARPRPVLTRLMLALHRARGDLQARFPDPFGADQLALAKWFVFLAPDEHHLSPALVRPVFESLSLRDRAAARLTRLRRRMAAARAPASPASGSAAAPTSQRVAARMPPQHPSIGVNVVGHFAMDTGVGQAARATVAALEGAGVRVATVPLEDALRDDQLLDGGAVGGLPFPITLLHVNADETPRVARRLPPVGLVGSHVIGYWCWELEHFPLSFSDSFAYVDEVWCPSHFNTASVRVLASKPARRMPPCVLAPSPPARLDRTAMGLDAGRFYFFSCFDTRSVVERKNPFGLIEAFRAVVADAARPVGLVLKVTAAELAPSLIGELRQAARGAPVVLLTEPASRAQMDAWFHACDAYVSLHRSEGLGMQPIEALFLGKAVVATAYGGVTDYLDASTAFPVAHRITSLDRDYGPYPRGATWAEPDLADAVQQMRAVIGDPEGVQVRAREGRRRVVELYGCEAAGARMATELTRALAALAQR